MASKAEKHSLLERFVELPVNKLRKAPWNYKEDDAFLQTQLQENIRKNGQIENVIVRELKNGLYEVVNGNHRYDAIAALNWKKIVAYNLGKVSLPHAQRIAVVTNETAFKSDPVKLADLMKQLQDEFKLEDLKMDMPWSEEQITNFAKLTEFNWEHPAQGEEKTDETDTAEGWVTVRLRLPTDVAESLKAQLERFKRRLHPEADLDAISPVEALKVMMKNVAALKDSAIV